MSGESGPWPAPGKLNLMLRVLGRRPDGYHDLQTVFQFLDFGDSLFFRVRSDGRIRRVNAVDGLDGEQDLAVRAARALQDFAACPLGADLRLIKRLPFGGGLGGGSSDAATTLVALNRVWGLDLPPRELSALGLRLGADVPVFIHGLAAWGEGVGELLAPLDLPEQWFLVVDPKCTVSTAAVFADPQLTRNSPKITMSDFVSGCVQNDCEPVVCHRYAEVAQALRWLASFGQARLTGTGGCVFAAFASQRSAQDVARRVPAPWRAIVARGLNRSPLLSWEPPGASGGAD